MCEDLTEYKLNIGDYNNSTDSTKRKAGPEAEQRQGRIQPSYQRASESPDGASGG